MVKAQITVEFMLSYSLYLFITLLMVFALVQSLNKIKAMGFSIIDKAAIQNKIELLNLKLINYCKNTYTELPLVNVVVISNVAYTEIKGKVVRINIIGGVSKDECI